MQYTYENVFNTVKKIISELCPYFDGDKMTNAALLKYDLGLDEYDMVDIICHIESHYNKMFDIDKLEKANDVQTFCHLLCKELNQEKIVVAQQKRTNVLNLIKRLFAKQRQ